MSTRDRQLEIVNMEALADSNDAYPLTLPTFRRVWLGQVANVVGDATYTVAIALFLLSRPDASRALGLVLGMAALGGVVSPLVGGVLADRYRRSAVIIVSDLIRACAVGGILVVGHDASLWALGGLAAVLGIGSGLYRPAYSAILPSLVPQEMLARANGLRSLVNRVGVIVGAATGGAVASAASPRWALVADLLTFLISITTLIGVHEESRRGKDPERRSFAADIGEGLRYVSSRPWMAGVMLQGTAQMALVAAPVALALHAHPMVILLASTLTGVGLAIFAVIWTTALQTSVPREQLGRVFSVDQVAVAGLTPVGFVVAGWLLQGVGQSAVAWLATVALATSILVALPLPGLRRLADESQPRVTEPAHRDSALAGPEPGLALPASGDLVP